MLYGHPELTNDRKPPADLTARIERSFPKIRVAWHNPWGTWVILQEPISAGMVWDFVLVCSNPGTGVPKEIGPWVLKWLELNYEGTANLESGILRKQRYDSATRAEARRRRREEEVVPRMARALMPEMKNSKASFAGCSVGTNLPPAAAFTTRESGLVVPRGA